ncbi:MAG: DUF3445 domain-containing protein [Rhodobacteraceae bacterium]|nr:DUF3445 domain-containing protein [Paracoccaceae bacterium]
MTPVLHDRLPFPPPWEAPGGARLPGMQPLDPADWILVDPAHAAQMALRDALVAARPDEVHALRPAARAAAGELLAQVLAALGHRPDHEVTTQVVRRPDGCRVALDHDAPMLTLGRLVQCDLCLLVPGADGMHRLEAAILCFPASWTLAEKLGRPLGAIHAPVPVYDEGLARRVQRLVDMLRPGRPLWRTNALLYADAALFHPRSETSPRVEHAGEARFLRAERQVLSLLPASGAVAFAIHSAVVPLERLPAATRAALIAHRGPAGAGPRGVREPPTLP